MRSEDDCKSLLARLKQAEADKPALEAPGAPQRRTVLEQRAYEQGKIAMLEWVTSTPEV